MDLTSCTTKFQEEDFVLNPSCPEVLTQYLDNGGVPSEANEALSTSYEGIESMIHMMTSWVDIYANGTEACLDAIETVFKENEQGLVQRLEDNLPVSEHAHRAMTSIATSKRWKTVVLDIANRHRSSALYNMVTREARLIEVGVEPKDLLSPDVLLSVISDQLSAVFQNGAVVSDDDLKALYKRLAAICTYDECTLVVGLRMFCDLSKTAEQPAMRALFRRIAQEMRKEAVAVMSAAEVVNPLVARQYVVRLAINIDFAASGVAMPKPVMDSLLALMSSISGKRPYDMENKIIIDAYRDLLGPLQISLYGEPRRQKPGENNPNGMDIDKTITAKENAMLLLSLCHVEVFDDLLVALYTNAHRANPDARRRSERSQTRRRCISLLLAFASVFICKDPQETIDIFTQDTPTETLEKLRQEVTDKYRRIELLAGACEALYPGCARFLMKHPNTTIIMEGINDPFLARGVLMWAKEGLIGGENPRNLFTTAPTHLTVLEKIAKVHPLLRQQALKAVRQALKRDLPSLEDTVRVDLRDLFMKSLVGMVSIQMAPELIQEFLEHYADDHFIDDSLRRRFVSGLLESIEPPYSRMFAALVLRLLQHPRIANVVEKDPKLGNMGIEFRRMAYEMGVS